MQRNVAELSRLVNVFEVQHQKAVQSLQAIDAELVAVKNQMAETLAATASDTGLGPLIVLHAMRRLSGLSAQVRQLDIDREQQVKQVVAADVRARRAREMVQKARYRAQSAELEKAITELVEQRTVRKHSSLT